MKVIQKIKAEKGITGVDLTIAIVILMIFISIITSLFYNNYLNSQAIRRTTQANTYVSKVFGEAMRREYDKVTTDQLVAYANLLDAGNISASSNTTVALATPYRMYIKVTNYKDLPENVGKDLKDYLKKIDITIKYTVGKNELTKTYSTVKQIAIE